MAAGLKILVVDDERLSRETTAKLLEGDGYIARPVENAEVALKQLAEARWDVVLTDLRMPRMNGLELIREIKRCAPEVDVVLMTAYGTADAATAAMDAGVSDLLTKPFSYRELEWRIRRIAANRARDREIRELREELARR
ncbi:MAG: response regulator [Deltaproteobacteria bacterium]|nr:response regulator [Deltaproteobacteria bacterium]